MKDQKRKMKRRFTQKNRHRQKIQWDEIQSDLARAQSRETRLKAIVTTIEDRCFTDTEGNFLTEAENWKLLKRILF